MAKKVYETNYGRAVIFRDVQALKAEDLKTMKGNDFIEIMQISEVTQEYLVADHYVLPIADALKINSDDGLVYVYNASLPYLQETAHLAEVEKNIVFNGAFMYPGRNMNKGQPSIFQWALVVMIFLVATFAIFK